MIQALGAADRVLLRMPSWLGDLVMAEPALGALVHKVGPERVSIAAPEHLLPVLEGLYPGVRRIGHAGRGGESVAAWRGHDVALLFTNSFRSAWVAARAGIGRRVGWSRDARGWLLSDAPRPALERGSLPFGIGKLGRGRRYLPRPFGATCVELLGRLGISTARTAPRLLPSDDARDLASARLKSLGLAPDEAYLLASVGSRPGSAKGLPVDQWARTLDALSESPVLLLVGPGEELCLAQVLDASRHPRLLAVKNPVAGLPELIALAAGARAALCTDGGPRHLIAAAGTPLAWVAGPSDPRHTADHLERQVLLREELACGPCQLEICPESGAAQGACMREIDPLALARAVHSPVE